MKRRVSRPVCSAAKPVVDQINLRLQKKTPVHLALGPKHNKTALILCGPVPFHGKLLPYHYYVGRRLENILKSQFGFSGTKMVMEQNPRYELDHFMHSLQQPNQTGVLMYCGHGNQYQVSPQIEKDGTAEYWEYGGIKDHELTAYINQVHPTSKLIIMSDSCYSDGMLNVDQINPQLQVVFMSAARETGDPDCRLAVYTEEGGIMTSCITSILEQDISQNQGRALRSFTYESLMDEVLVRLGFEPSNPYAPRITFITSSMKQHGLF